MNGSSICSLVLWYPFASFPKSIAFLLFNSIETVLGQVPGFGISNSEHIISTNSSVDT